MVREGKGIQLLLVQRRSKRRNRELMTMKLRAGTNLGIDRGVVDIQALVRRKKERVAMKGGRKKEIEDLMIAVDRFMVQDKH